MKESKVITMSRILSKCSMCSAWELKCKAQSPQMWDIFAKTCVEEGERNYGMFSNKVVLSFLYQTPKLQKFIEACIL